MDTAASRSRRQQAAPPDRSVAGPARRPPIARTRRRGRRIMQNTNGNTHSSALAVGFALGVAALGVLALTAVFAITGCGGEQGSSTAAQPTAPTEQIAVAAMPAVSVPPSTSEPSRLVA